MKSVRKSNVVHRICSGVTAFIFFTGSMLTPLPRNAQAVNAPASVSDLSEARLDIEKLVVPENFGMISERYRALNTPNADRTFILIQDSHANLEAQNNISNIIESLGTLAKMHIGMIFVEGGKGELQTGRVRALAGSAVRSMIAQYLLKIGYLSGPEFYAVTVKGSPSPLYGIEDKDLYYQNLDAFRKTYAVRGKNEEIISALKRALLLVRQKICSPGLIELYRKEDAYNEGTLSFVDFLRYLTVQPGGSKADLSRYPNLRIAVQSIEVEGKIAAKRVDAQKEALIKALANRLVKEDLAKLVQKSFEYRTGKILASDFYGYLMRVASDNGVIDAAETQLAAAGDWNKLQSRSRFADLLMFHVVLELQKNIDHEKLFGEMQLLAQETKKRLFSSGAVAQFDEIWKNLDLAGKLVNLKMTRDEIAYLGTHRDALDLGRAVTFVRKHAGALPRDIEAGMSDIGAFDTEPATAFYGDALKRDSVLFTNTIRKMHEGNVRNAVVVIGGFHKDGIKEKLRAGGYSYVVMTPRVVTKYDDTLYTSIMLGRQTDLDRFLERVGTRLAPVQRTSVEMDERLFNQLVEFIKISAAALEPGREAEGKVKIVDRSVTEKDGVRTVTFQTYGARWTFAIKDGTIISQTFTPLRAGMPALVRSVLGTDRDVDIPSSGALSMEIMEIIERTANLAKVERDATDALENNKDLPPDVRQLLAQIRLFALVVAAARSFGTVWKADAVINAVNALQGRSELLDPETFFMIPVWMCGLYLSAKQKDVSGRHELETYFLENGFKAHGDYLMDAGKTAEAMQAYGAADAFIEKAEKTGRYVSEIVSYYRHAAERLAAAGEPAARAFAGRLYQEAYDIFVKRGILQNEIPVFAGIVKGLAETKYANAADSALLKKFSMYGDALDFVSEHTIAPDGSIALSARDAKIVADQIIGPMVETGFALAQVDKRGLPAAQLERFGATIRYYNNAVGYLRSLVFSGDVPLTFDPDRYAAVLDDYRKTINRLISTIGNQGETIRERQRIINASLGMYDQLQQSVELYENLFTDYRVLLQKRTGAENSPTVAPALYAELVRKHLPALKSKIDEENVRNKPLMAREKKIAELEKLVGEKRGPHADLADNMILLGMLYFYQRNDPKRATDMYYDALALYQQYPDLRQKKRDLNRLYSLITKSLTNYYWRMGITTGDFTRGFYEEDGGPLIPADAGVHYLMDRVDELFRRAQQYGDAIDPVTLLGLSDLLLQLNKARIYTEREKKEADAFETEVLPLMEKDYAAAKTQLEVLANRLIPYKNERRDEMRKQLARLEQEGKIDPAKQDKYDALKETLERYDNRQEMVDFFRDIFELNRRFLNIEKTDVVSIKTFRANAGKLTARLARDAARMQVPEPVEEAGWAEWAWAGAAGFTMAVVDFFSSFQLRDNDPAYVSTEDYSDANKWLRYVRGKEQAVTRQNQIIKLTCAGVERNFAVDEEMLKPYMSKEKLAEILQQGIDARERLFGTDIYKNLKRGNLISELTFTPPRGLAGTRFAEFLERNKEKYAYVAGKLRLKGIMTETERQQLAAVFTVKDREALSALKSFDDLFAMSQPFTIAVDQKTPGGLLFLDHIENSFFLMNKAVLDRMKDHPDECIAQIQAGFTHELRHEGGVPGSEAGELKLTCEDVVLTEHLIQGRPAASIAAFIDLLRVYRPEATGSLFWSMLSFRNIFRGMSAAEQAAELKKLIESGFAQKEIKLMYQGPDKRLRIKTMQVPLIFGGNVYQKIRIVATDADGFVMDAVNERNESKKLFWSFNPGSGKAGQLKEKVYTASRDRSLAENRDNPVDADMRIIVMDPDDSLLPMKGARSLKSYLKLHVRSDVMEKLKEAVSLFQRLSKEQTAFLLDGIGIDSFVVDGKGKLNLVKYGTGVSASDAAQAEAHYLGIYKNLVNEIIASSQPDVKEEIGAALSEAVKGAGTLAAARERVEAIERQVPARVSALGKPTPHEEFLAEIRRRWESRQGEEAVTLKTIAEEISRERGWALTAGENKAAEANAIANAIIRDAESRMKQRQSSGKEFTPGEHDALIFDLVSAYLIMPFKVSQKKILNDITAAVEAGLLDAGKWVLAQTKYGVAPRTGLKVAAFPAKLNKTYCVDYYETTDGTRYDPETDIGQLQTAVRAKRGAEPVAFDFGRGITFSGIIDPDFENIQKRDLKKLIMDKLPVHQQVFPDWETRLKGLGSLFEGKPREITVAYLMKSPNAFENHKGDNFCGVTEAVFTALKRRPDILDILLVAGIYHEFRHDADPAATEQELCEETVRFVWGLLAEANVEIADFLPVLEDLFSIEDKDAETPNFFKSFVQMSHIFTPGVLIGNERLFNLYGKYTAGNYLIADCHLSGDTVENNRKIRELFKKLMVTAVHHYPDPTLRRETATSQLIQFLVRNRHNRDIENIDTFSYVTSHVDPDSMLAYFVLKNWKTLKHDAATLRIIIEAARYADYGLLVRKGMKEPLKTRMQFFANLIFGMQKEINAPRRSVVKVPEPLDEQTRKALLSLKGQTNGRCEYRDDMLVYAGVMPIQVREKLKRLCGPALEQTIEDLFSLSQQNAKEKIFMRVCDEIPDLMKAFKQLSQQDIGIIESAIDLQLQGKDNKTPATEETGVLPGGFERYTPYLKNRADELRNTARAVNKALTAPGKFGYDPVSGIALIEISKGPLVYNANIYAYLNYLRDSIGKEPGTEARGVFYDPATLAYLRSLEKNPLNAWEPVMIIQTRAPPIKEAKGSYTISLCPYDNPADMPDLSGLYDILNAAEPDVRFKGWGGRADGGGSHRDAGSGLTKEQVTGIVEQYLQSQYPRTAQKLYATQDFLNTFVNSPVCVPHRADILKNIPSEGGVKQTGPAFAEEILNGILGIADNTVFEQLVHEAVARKALSRYEVMILDRQRAFLRKYLVLKQKSAETAADYAAFMEENTIYGRGLNERDSQLQMELFAEPQSISDFTKARLDLLGMELTADAIIGALFTKEDLKGMSPEKLNEINRTIRSPAFMRFFASAGEARAQGRVIAFDKRNFFNADETTLIPGYEAYVRLLRYFADKTGTGRVIVFNCLAREDQVPLVHSQLDDEIGKIEGVIELTGVRERMPARIEAAAKGKELSLFVYQDNVKYFMKMIQGILDICVVRADGKLIDLSKEQRELIRTIDPALAAGIEAGLYEFLPPVTYDSVSFGKAQKAAIALELAA